MAVIALYVSSANMHTMKRCTSCNEEKTPDNFHKHPGTRDGLETRCRSCRNAQNRAHYESRREHYREVRKRWYETHRDEHRERVLMKRDKLAHAERARRWGQTPEGRLKKRENQAVRRTEKGSYRDARRLGRFYKDVLERDGMTCHICGETIPSLDELHFDHVVPLSKGGLHMLENVRPAHARCNRTKAARPT